VSHSPDTRTTARQHANGAAGPGPLIGVFGAFDTGDLGEVALRRVIEHELSRRRPDIELAALAPFGSERPVPGDEGRPARPLPPPADGLGVDALIITGNVLATDSEWAERYGVGPDVLAGRGVAALAATGMRAATAAAAQVIWFGVGGPDGADVDFSGLAGRDVWVRDAVAQERIGGTAAQSGDPVLLASRVFEPDALRRRTDLLRLCGALPAGPRLVLEVTHGVEPPALEAELAEAIRAALRADPTLSLIVLTLNPTAPVTSGLYFGGPLEAQVHYLPTWVGLDDIAAAISGATAVLSTTSAGAHLAAALGAPAAALETIGNQSQVDGIPTFGTELTQHVAALLAKGKAVDIAAAVTTLDGAFAELAERLPRTSSSSKANVLRDPTDSALALLQQRLVDERTALQAELSRLQAELEHLQASPEQRIARPIREGYRRWKRRRT
jgi:hypothetical protein